MKPKPKLAAYVRVSTDNKSQTTESQRYAIKQWAKLNHVNTSELKWFEDKQSGSTIDRPELKKLLWQIDRGRIDCLVVFRLDRLARNTRDGLQILADLGNKGIRVVSISENIDFNNSTGRLIASILLSVASFEREVLKERIKAGMESAKQRGIHVGRKRNPTKYLEVQKMRQKGMSVIDIADKLKIRRQSVYYLLEQGVSLKEAV